MVSPSMDFESSDDIHVRCRVRQSPYAAPGQFGEEMEMTCTMRNWQRKRSVSASRLDDVLPSMTSSSNSWPKLVNDDDDGPELLLQLVVRGNSPYGGRDGHFSQRFSSFGSSSSATRKRLLRRHGSPGRFSLQKAKRVAYRILVSNVTVADMHDPHVLYLTTRSHGYFEFRFLTRNSHDMMVAFLRTSLPRDRVLYQTEKEMRRRDTFYDAETFTAIRIEEGLRTESFSQRLRRSMAHMALQFGEMSMALSTCGCDHEAIAARDEADPDDSQRQPPSPPPPSRTFRDLEYSRSLDSMIASAPKGKSMSDFHHLKPELEVAHN